MEYGASMILKTWGEIWGANGFKTWGETRGGSLVKKMGQNMGCQYKVVFNHFFGFSSKRRL